MANGELPPDVPQEPNKPDIPERPTRGPWGRRQEPSDFGRPEERQRPNPLFGGKPPDEPPKEKPKGPLDWMENLKDLDPENEQQALFQLGWMAGDMPPHVRAAARHAYEKKYGPLTSDEWKKWKEKMGYSESA